MNYEYLMKDTEQSVLETLKKTMKIELMKIQRIQKT